MNFRGLLVATILLAVAGGTIYFLERNKKDDTATAVSKEGKLFAVEGKDIQEITVQPAAGEAVRLVKDGEKWTITEPKQLPADDAAIASMTGSLGSATVNDTIEEAPASLKEYGLDPPKTVVQFKLKDAQHTLQIGEDTPTGSAVYARTAAKPRVVTIPSYIANDFRKSLFDLRDKSLLKVDTATASRAWLKNKTGQLEMVKADDRWQITAPFAGRADQFAAGDVVRRAADARMQEAIADQAAGQEAKYGLASPEILLKVQDSKGEHELRISAEKDGKRYARSSDQQGIFTVGLDIANDLNKPAADLRNKDVFDMSSWTATRLTAATPEGQVAVQKQGDDWKAAADNKKKIETNLVSEALDKLKAIRATAFPAPGPPAKYGLDKPEIRAEVAWGDKNQSETVEVGQAGGKFYARRVNEAAVYEVGKDEVAAAREAINKVK